jgi:hypothetical protein
MTMWYAVKIRPKGEKERIAAWNTTQPLPPDVIARSPDAFHSHSDAMGWATADDRKAKDWNDGDGNPTKD